MPHPQGSKRTGRPWLPRFGIGTLLIIMLVLAVTAAAAGYMVRSLNQPEQSGVFSPYLIFMIFTLAAPMVLMILLSVMRQIALWLRRRR